MAVRRNVSPRTILLFGAAGQVGWELTRSLQSLGQVLRVGNRSVAPGENLDHRVDLTDEAAIRRLLREVAPHLVVNAAAYTAVDRAETEPELAEAINARAPAVIAEEARQLGAALVHYSTDYVFDGSGDLPWMEDDPTGPLSVYGATKLAGEMAVRTAGGPHLVLRVSWIYGLHGNNFLRTMLRLGGQRTELSVVDDQIGAPTSARTIATITAQILAQGGSDWNGFLGDQGGVVHLATRGATSWYQYACEIFRLARAYGLPLKVENVKPIPGIAYPTPARRPHNSRLDCSRLTERFGLTTPTWEHDLAQNFAAMRAFVQAA